MVLPALSTCAFWLSHFSLPLKSMHHDIESFCHALTLEYSIVPVFSPGSVCSASVQHAASLHVACLKRLLLQMDTATKSVQTNNQKMKGVLRRIRSQRNFCIDIILITILLAVAGWIYTMVA